MEDKQNILSKAYKIDGKDNNGWYYLHLEGKPYEIGYKHGFLMADELKEELRVNMFQTKWDTGKDFSFFADNAERMWFDMMPEEYLSEMQGITDGASDGGFKLTLKDVMAWNE